MLEWLTFPGIASVPGLVHGVTQRGGGASRGPWASLNLGRSTGDAPDAVEENARRVRERLGAKGPLRWPRQVHGATVVPAEAASPWDPPDADAVVTAAPGVAVGVLGADCPVVLVVDPVRRALGVVHSGWRGTLAGVLPATIRALAQRHGSRPADLRVAIGPTISAARYEVGPEVAGPFRAGFPQASAVLEPGRGDRSHLDLAAALALQARREGVPEAAIEDCRLCTFEERDRFFSHRRDGPRTGRHALVARWLDPSEETSDPSTRR